VYVFAAPTKLLRMAVVLLASGSTYVGSAISSTTVVAVMVKLRMYERLTYVSMPRVGPAVPDPLVGGCTGVSPSGCWSRSE
jgi:hypothetical protein